MKPGNAFRQINHNFKSTAIREGGSSHGGGRGPPRSQKPPKSGFPRAGFCCGCFWRHRGVNGTTAVPQPGQTLQSALQTASDRHRGDCQLRQPFNFLGLVCFAVVSASSSLRHRENPDTGRPPIQGDQERHSAQGIWHPQLTWNLMIKAKTLQHWRKAPVRASPSPVARTRLQRAILLPTVIGYLSLSTLKHPVTEGSTRCYLMTLKLLFLLEHGLLL